MAHSHHHHHGPNAHRHPDHDTATPAARPKGLFLTRYGRYIVAAIIVVGALAAACLTLVEPGEAVVVTRFGNPVRVISTPGLALRWPAPIESLIRVDLRLRTTSSGLQDVGTRDGLRILVQAYIAWQAPPDHEQILQFLRAVRNQPDLAAEQLRSYLGSSLEIVASGFDLSSLINTDSGKIQIDQFEKRIRDRLDEESRKIYGVAIRQVGLERLTLPTETLNATVERMRAERGVVAAERQAEGERAAAEITSDAERDARILVAQSKADAARIDADARGKAADSYEKAYASNPKLYTLLRSLDTLANVIGPNTRLILRTDAAPFRSLVEGPGETTPAAPAAVAGPSK
jgi:modulator of FtsH protease HflC